MSRGRHLAGDGQDLSIGTIVTEAEGGDAGRVCDLFLGQALVDFGGERAWILLGDLKVADDQEWPP